jgi:ABC-type branched-subunit amino acid transport system substrate-binding protein
MIDYKRKKQFILLIILVLIFSSCARNTSIFIKNRKIIIGHLDNFTGNLSVYSESSKLGVDAAVSYINESQLMYPYTFEVKEFNMQSNPQKFVKDFDNQAQTVAAWIASAYYTGSATYKVVNNKYHIPFLFPITTYSDLGIGYNNIFQLVSRNDTLGFYSLQFLDSIDSKRVLVWRDLNMNYSLQYSNAFIQYFPIISKKAKLVDIMNASFNDEESYNKVLNYIKENNIDTVFLPAGEDTINKFLSRFSASMRTKIKLIIGDEGIWGSSILYKGVAITPYTPDCYYIFYNNIEDTLSNYSKNNNPSLIFFRDYMKQHFSANSSIPTVAQYFNATIILAEGIKRLLNKEVENHAFFKTSQDFYTRLTDELKGIKNFNTLTTNISIETDGTIKQELYKQKITSARTEIIGFINQSDTSKKQKSIDKKSK